MTQTMVPLSAEIEAPVGRQRAQPRPEIRNKPALSHFWYALLWGPCWAISQVWFRYSFAGRGNVPMTGPVLLVSNHQSNLDPVIVGIACPRQLKYLARIGLFFWPFNLWIRSLGAVPIDRDKGSIAGIKTTLRLLNEGNAVLVFPEGSRTPDGKLQDMLPGFCLLARRTGATIVPIGIRGAYEAMPRGSAFVRPRRIRLVFGRPIVQQQYGHWPDAQLTRYVTERIAEAMRM